VRAHAKSILFVKEAFDAVVIPGGPGAKTLATEAREALTTAYKSGSLVAAICAGLHRCFIFCLSLVMHVDE
jgi:putative intracellular protease/amidase